MKLEDKLFLVDTKKFKDSHIIIKVEKCEECEDKFCLKICPAKVYEQSEDGKTINVAYENCLECGSCRVVCSKNAIEWENPYGGFGVTFKNG
ncbi:MAG: 4Fe-4S dicluster domain-containing protein [Candidatus Omnitrophica bacterium]|nr:4Fe-4S dicluster domain-containing protein [Candidatus Omnitrophota bacterium]